MVPSPVSEPTPCNILLVDDRPSLRKVIRLLIDSDPRFKVVAEVGTPDEAIAAALRINPGLAIVDLALGLPTTGFDLIVKLRQKCPQLAILVLSMHSADLYARQALRAGALGYVMKDQATEQLHAAMAAVLHGRVWLRE